MASPPQAAAAAAAESMSVISQDTIQAHILPRLDGPTLASTSCASTELHSLSSHQDLWANLCHSTWPSTSTPHVDNVISTFSTYGHRSFFSHSFPLPTPDVEDDHPTGPMPQLKLDHHRPSELISAVDIFYKNKLIFSKVVETETSSAWFLCSPFQVDMLDSKDMCPTTKLPEMVEELRLSWIVIDPAGRRAVNLSSHRPVAVHRHWLNGEVHARYATVVGVGGGELVECSSVVVVTCGGEGMHVREVSLQVEDMDGRLLNGKDSLGILHKVLEGRRGISLGGRREEVGKKRYEMFLEMKKERKERKLRAERTSDTLCVCFGVFVSVSLGLFLLVHKF